VYERLHELRPSGFERFTRLVFSGDIICSAQFPEGKILLLEKVPGEQLFGIWNSLPVAEKAHVFNECSSAIQTLRSISIRLLDSGRHNILYDRMSGKVTLVDFEAIDDLGGVRVTSLNPELVSIFGVTGMSQFIHSG
jgi:serine/threonine protein kinase